MSGKTLKDKLTNLSQYKFELRRIAYNSKKKKEEKAHKIHKIGGIPGLFFAYIMLNMVIDAIWGLTTSALYKAIALGGIIFLGLRVTWWLNRDNNGH